MPEIEMRSVETVYIMRVTVSDIQEFKKHAELVIIICTFQPCRVRISRCKLERDTRSLEICSGKIWKRELAKRKWSNIKMNNFEMVVVVMIVAL